MRCLVAAAGGGHEPVPRSDEPDEGEPDEEARHAQLFAR
jgi:hypothetical protein